VSGNDRSSGGGEPSAGTGESASGGGPSGGTSDHPSSDTGGQTPGRLSASNDREPSLSHDEGE
jgi:hypothetical protein